MYLVYKWYYDSDFDTQTTFYILGLYDTEKQAKRATIKEYNAQYIKIDKNKNTWISL